MSAQSGKNRTFLAATRKKDRLSVRAGAKAAAILESVPAGRQGKLAGAKVRECFAEAVIAEYGTAAAVYILENVQGVYAIRDDAPRKASATGPAPVHLKVYTTEAIIKADLDAQQESIKRRMRAGGVYFDRLKPYSSTGDMRSRAPFAARVAELRAELESAAQDSVSEADGAGASAWTQADIEATVAGVENDRLADAIRRAMEASLLR